MFLKKRFGGGYSLTIQKKTAEKKRALGKHIKKIIRTAKMVSSVSTEVTYKLPSDTRHKFSELFNSLDS